MTPLDALLLGVLQGLTEFLPVSSSGHLVLAENLLNIHFSKETLNAFDVILHAGTLAALLLYFRKTWKRLILSFFTYFSDNTKKEDKLLIHILILGTIPVVLAGLFFKDFIDEFFRDPKRVLMCMGFIGILFLFAEKFPKEKLKKKIGLKEGLIIGLFQALALIPGVSRSGTTISIAMFQGIPRHKAAEFSFLLGTPALAAATSYISFQIFNGTLTPPSLPLILVGFLSSFFVSILCVHYLLKFLKKYSLRVFSFYLISISVIGIILESISK
ncbi:undecaprenyl-diphosphatase UppP [Candidatus Peregrinibacteria bacterium]|jgi:undecaprenyl-diphosphatase|nr:undecaprenyl-diphosphatase UppP [Candidatus Peregrinibacteria bacterium]